MLSSQTRFGFLSRMRRAEGISPKVDRNEITRLGLSSKKVYEASLCASLSLAILLFLFFPRFTPKFSIAATSQEIVQMEEVEQTRQDLRAPPPPRPAIPIEAPADEVLEDVELASSEMIAAEDVAPPPPQPSDHEEEQYFVAVEDMPEIIGGISAIARALEYPDLAIRAQVQGTVFVLAYVNEKGEVVRTEVLKGIGAGCDEAAKAAVKSVRFIPGRQRGRAVKVKVSIPVVFRLRTS